MSRPWTPRPPALADLFPLPPAYDDVGAEEAATVLQTAGLPATDATVRRLRRGDTNNRKPDAFGYFYIEVSGIELPLFAKILPLEEAAHHDRSEALARWLTEHGAPCQAATAIEGTFDRVAYIYRYRSLRFAEPNMDDATRLGRGLAVLHQLLPTWPEADAVKVAGMARLQMLNARLSAILEAPDDYPLPIETVQFLSEKAGHLFEPHSTAIQVHGDLNLANVAFDTVSSEPIFMDFEDALVSYLPPETDVAFLLQRLALIAEVPDDVRHECTVAFLRGYRDQGGSIDMANTQALIETMEWLALRGLVMLGELHARGLPITSGETNKFMALASNAISSGGCLDIALTEV